MRQRVRSEVGGAQVDQRRQGMGGEDVDIAQAVPADYRPLDGVLPWAIAAAAERLWALSEQLTDSR
ncbi:hypothetical protein [Burkholderia sp. D-99]|uniref:hypothetical protein n=1 Tax=Burkholderia sp. D-99 TaxID=2717316 RepID=UPI001FB64FCC|nr:hypothetical protein [Burkholderia sp. D-99]